MTEVKVVNYEELASEYYNSVRHPTCANFRAASALVLKKWLPGVTRQRGWTCEVGPGRSLVAEQITEIGGDPGHLILVDSSRSMLRHSETWMSKGACLAVGDARKLPLRSESLLLLVASVGDPYNEPLFWREVYRTLKAGAVAVFTTPSHDWASSFRPYANGRKATAEFELADGRHVYVPSLVYSEKEQSDMIRSQGLSVREVLHVPISALSGQPLSPKLVVGRGPTASVLTGYLIVKH